MMNCRFKCDSVVTPDEGSTNINMSVEYHGDDPDHPNRKYWEATPCGNLSFSLDPKVYKGVLPIEGEVYDIYITPVPVPCDVEPDGESPDESPVKEPA